METPAPRTIFTNMYSLLTPYNIQAPWPQSLILPDPFSPDVVAQSNERQLMQVSACPHTDRKHYAKEMCSRCYHKYGREKLAWACSHKHRHHYAKGRCQTCYLKMYYKRRH